eukprot:m.179068 g.179068  ORF g.179068 m.179068 type:complete len:401 (-) comp14675_c0_seq1:137-1339(-)
MDVRTSPLRPLSIHPAVADQATELSTRIRHKKREDGNDPTGDQYTDARRHKERSALQKLDGNATSKTNPITLDAVNCSVASKVDGVPAGLAEIDTASVDGLASNGDGDATESSPGPSLQSVDDLAPQLGGPIVEVVVDDPAHVPEYIDDIMEYLRSSETKFMPKAAYMRKQKDINHSMRSILADWLVEVAQEYKLDPQTLFIAIGYIDRFLSEMSVQRTKLQLVGVTAMLLASKYEEIYPPAVDEFVYITDNTYSREQILKMEHLILKVLRFDMGGVTPYAFLQRYLVVAGADKTTTDLAMYLLESTLLDGDRYMRYKPSLMAAASLCNALYATKQPCWTPTLAHYSKLSVEDIRECVNDIYYTFSNAALAPQQAVREKYSSDRYNSVSQIPPPLTPPLH